MSKARTDTAAEVISLYDGERGLMGISKRLGLHGPGNHNMGYWEDDTVNLEAANHVLYRQIWQQVPEESRRGPCLDVACGLGGGSKFYASQLGPGQVVGINISDEQLESCRTFATGVEFRKMNAAEMDFDDSSFQIVFCCEAAFHFYTREDFFREAHRVLKEGGWLVVADLAVNQSAGEVMPGLGGAGHPKENWFEGDHDQRLSEYKALLDKTGFRSITVRDVTEPCSRGFFRNFAKDATLTNTELRQKYNVGPDKMTDALCDFCRMQAKYFIARSEKSKGLEPYVLASAQK